MDLHEYARNLSKIVKEGKDPREKKPFIVFNCEDFRKYISLSSSWVLTLDNFQIHLVQPNDIALYANITEKALHDARHFYDNNPAWYMKRQSGGMIPVTQNTELLYFDYFESIMKAVIFAFTSLETFANICLPENYVYIDIKGKHINKEAIERKRSLDFKLEFVLSDILRTPDPKKEIWWPIYTKLKNIRDRIIHSKASTAEERFSILLSPNIFEIIGCFRQILTYYGGFIAYNYVSLLDEFPYGFGFDEFEAKTISNAEYERLYNNMHNPWRPGN
jgi:hypothetical protein